MLMSSQILCNSSNETFQLSTYLKLFCFLRACEKDVTVRVAAVPGHMKELIRLDHLGKTPEIFNHCIYVSALGIRSCALYICESICIHAIVLHTAILRSVSSWFNLVAQRRRRQDRRTKGDYRRGCGEGGTLNLTDIPSVDTLRVMS
jgi:hypothetical protein